MGGGEHHDKDKGLISNIVGHVVGHDQHGGGYPQQQGYPPQGYPPQGYPPADYPAPHSSGGKLFSLGPFFTFFSHVFRLKLLVKHIMKAGVGLMDFTAPVESEKKKKKALLILINFF